jgi:hypothetical protein
MITLFRAAIDGAFSGPLPIFWNRSQFTRRTVRSGAPDFDPWRTSSSKSIVSTIGGYISQGCGFKCARRGGQGIETWSHQIVESVERQQQEAEQCQKDDTPEILCATPTRNSDQQLMRICELFSLNGTPKAVAKRGHYRYFYPIELYLLSKMSDCADHLKYRVIRGPLGWLFEGQSSGQKPDGSRIELFRRLVARRIEFRIVGRDGSLNNGAFIFQMYRNIMCDSVRQLRPSRAFERLANVPKDALSADRWDGIVT